MLKRVFIGIFRSHEQTGEKAKDPALKTRYYRISKEKAWDEVISVLKKKSNYKVLHQVVNVGEIVCERKTFFGRKQDITINLFAVTPVKTAIDIYSASRGSFGDLGSNYKTIIEIFKDLDRKFANLKV